MGRRDVLQLDNIATQDGYPSNDNDPAGALSDQHADLLSLDVAGADVYVQLRPYDGDRENALDWTSEDQRIVAPKSLILPDVAGVRLRSARAGSPARVTAQLFQPDDPGRPSAASAAVQVITTVGQTGVQHNENLQGAENTLDLDDSTQILWTVTDDAPNGRVKIAAAQPAAAGDLSGAYPGPAVAGLQGRPVIAAAPAANQGLVWTGAAWAPAAIVNSFNGRNGAVVPTAGDYTAAQVTNAADKSSGATQVFTAALEALNSIGVETLAAGSGSPAFTPILDQELSFVAQHSGLASGTVTINNPGHFPAAGLALFFTVTITTPSINVTGTLWGTAYRFGSITSNVALAAGSSYTWAFVALGDFSRCVCIGSSSGSWT